MSRTAPKTTVHHISAQDTGIDESEVAHSEVDLEPH